MVSNTHSSLCLRIIVPSLLTSWAASGISPPVLTSHALSGGIISGALSRYQAVSTEAVPVASLPELDVHRSELWGGRWWEWGIPNRRDALGSKQYIWFPGLDITVGSGLYMKTFMRNKVTFKIAQHWLLISRNVLCQASLVLHFVFLNANWKSNLLFLVFIYHFVVLARITQTNNSKAYLEAQLLIGLAKSKGYSFKSQLSSWFMATCATADYPQHRMLWKQKKMWFKNLRRQSDSASYLLCPVLCI